jgi:hypothetical protein
MTLQFLVRRMEDLAKFENVRRCKINDLPSDRVAGVGRLEGARSREGRKNQRKNGDEGGTQLLAAVGWGLFKIV